MNGGSRVRSDDAEFQAESRSRHHEMDYDDGDEADQETAPDTVVPKSRGSRSSTASVRVCGTVVDGSRKASFTSTFR